MENNDEKKISYWAKFKEIWQNKRYRSLIILGLYIIIYIFLIIVLGSSNETTTLPPETQEEPKTALENYQDMTNYEFVLEITEQKDSNEIKHSYNGKTDGEVTIINDTYYLKDNIIYEIVGEQIRILEATLVEINLFKLKPANLYELINLGELNYETKFADESMEKSYLVPLKDVIKNFKGEDIADPKTTIEIKYKEENNNITSIELDLSNYQKHYYENTDIYNVKITYNNIGNVETLKQDYQVLTSS